MSEADSPEFKDDSQEHSGGEGYYPCSWIKVDRFIRYPEEIVMENCESEVDDEHKEEITYCCFEADYEVLSKRFITLEQGSLSVFQEEMKQETCTEECGNGEGMSCESASHLVGGFGGEGFLTSHFLSPIIMTTHMSGQARIGRKESA